MPSSPAERRFLLCSNRVVRYSELYQHAGFHIIGELRYLYKKIKSGDEEHGLKVTVLAYYQTHVNADEVPPITPKILMYIDGADNILCMHNDCDRFVRWEIGQAGLEVLKERYSLQDKPKDIFVDV